MREIICPIGSTISPTHMATMETFRVGGYIRPGTLTCSVCGVSDLLCSDVDKIISDRVRKFLATRIRDL